MNKKIYFIGSKDLKDTLERSLQLIGWKIEDFIGWNVDDLIIYQLEKVDIPSFHIPDNLLIITKNNKLIEYNNTNIFYYNQLNNLKFNFSRFIINYFQRLNNRPSDFYENKEVVNLLYNRQTRDLDNLVANINIKNSHIIKKFKYSDHLSEQPVKTLVYIEYPEKPIIIKNKILTIYKGYTLAQKKELKGKNPLVPKLFINKVDKSAIKKILKYLN
jgi:hypothetical protein